MNPKHVRTLCYLIAVAMVLVLFRFVGKNASHNLSATKNRLVHDAMLAAHYEIQSIPERHYHGWPPRSIAIDLAKRMNQRWEPGSAEEKEMVDSLPKVLKSTTFVAEKPTAPWQIVIVWDDANHMFRMDGYGHRLDQPLTSKILLFDSSQAYKGGTEKGL